MNIFQALILAVVEGISEFLPISSTGHLILVSRLLSIPQTEFVKSFEIIIQFGAILAVVVLYWRRFLTDTRSLSRVLIAFVPTMVVGLVLYKFIKTFLLENTFIVSVSLIVGGLLIIFLEWFYKSKKFHINKISDVSPIKSAIIGLGQALAVVPGVSRSASTILTGLFLGLDRKTAAEFSFFLAVPTMAAASVLDLSKSSWGFSANEWLVLGVGFVSAFVTALFAVKWFISFVQKHSFTPFAIYRIIVGLLFLVLVGG